MRAAVLGLGYVGTVTAAILAAEGHEIRAVDVDATKVHLVEAGTSPVLEPGLDALVSAGTSSGRLSATTCAATAVAHADVSLVCVGTPSSPTGNTDLDYVRRAAGDIADALAGDPMGRRRHHAVVVRSTVPPGTTDTLIGPLLQRRLASSQAVVGTGMCPEFLREGSAISDFYESPFTVIGTADDAVAAIVRTLLSFLPGPLRVVGTREAEALKYACNAFHATKVSFVNELGRLFRQVGVDTREVMDLFCSDHKLNISSSYLLPGFAFGGSCLPKDLRSLLYQARMNCIDLPQLAGTLATNELTISDVIARVLATDARVVALLGLSFKAQSDDLRESPYVDLAETLIGKGYSLQIFDPLVDTARLVGSNRRYLSSKLPHVQRALRPTAVAALADADLALVASSDPSVVDAVLAYKPPKVIDLNGRLGALAEALPGYEGVTW